MEKDKRNHEEKEVTLIRILGKDLPGDKKLLVGLTKIKGISWAFASAICKILGLDKNKQIQDLETEETEKLEEFVKNPKILYEQLLLFH